VLCDELSRAREVLRRARAEGTEAAWAALFEPVDLEKELPVRLRVSVEAPSSEAREMAAGWVLGHLTALVYRMEADRGLFARPSVDEFRASFQECSHRPVRGGALP